jgi:tellurite resistance protein TehA-like permease
MTFLWFLIYRLYCATSSVRYWGRRRFTAAGLGILGAATVAALVGTDTENNVAYQAFTLLACLLLVAFVFSWFFRAHFAATRLLPRFGTVGAPLN